MRGYDRIESDQSTIDTGWVPAKYNNAITLEREHYFKRMVIDKDIDNIVINNMIDEYK